MATGDYATACPKLAASQELAPAPDTAMDLGLCYQKASEVAFKAAYDLARGPAEQPAVPVSSASPSVSEDASQGHTQRIVALTIVGAGAAGVIAGIVTGFMAKNAYDTAGQVVAPCGACASAGVASFHSAQQLATASTVSLLLGAGALGAGALVFFLAPRPKLGAATPVRIGFMPSTQGVSVSVARSF
ncbi:MAG: hypothetical protein JO179_22140 [Solirubrobacterales bacterium]|nr:hypothetical protein [Solirubrobacterales bacterium]